MVIVVPNTAIACELTPKIMTSIKLDNLNCYLGCVYPLQYKAYNRCKCAKKVRDRVKVTPSYSNPGVT